MDDCCFALVQSGHSLTRVTEDGENFSLREATVQPLIHLFHYLTRWVQRVRQKVVILSGDKYYFTMFTSQPCLPNRKQVNNQSTNTSILRGLKNLGFIVYQLLNKQIASILAFPNDAVQVPILKTSNKECIGTA